MLKPKVTLNLNSKDLAFRGQKEKNADVEHLEDLTSEKTNNVKIVDEKQQVYGDYSEALQQSHTKSERMKARVS